MSKEIDYLDKILNYQPLTLVERTIIECIKEKIQRLEAIDNANPSEALECLRQIGVIETYHRGDGTLLKDSIMFKPEYDTIKQALLKAQEPKHYIKWEDLKFEHTPKMIDVKMSGNKYKLVVGYNGAGSNLAILRNDKQHYYFFKYDKQFFNDLHLERVEE